jgi:hypothetical protein
VKESEPEKEAFGLRKLPGRLAGDAVEEVPVGGDDLLAVDAPVLGILRIDEFLKEPVDPLGLIALAGEAFL